MYSIIIITITAIIGLYLGLYNSTKKYVLAFNLLGILGAILENVYLWDHPFLSYNDMIQSDHYAIAYSTLLLTITGIILIFSKGYLESIKTHITEFYSIMLFGLAGGMLMVSFQNLSLLFIGLEILSVSSYILAGIQKRDLLSNEAAMKYFLMGSFFTAILLLGIAFLYGATGSFNLTLIQGSISKGTAILPFLNLGVLLILMALCFKVSISPFHFWTPDVYEGSPILVTSYMSTIVKIAGFGAFLHLFLVDFSTLIPHLSTTLWILVCLTLCVGNIGALTQKSMKRMLAYSGISHAGYMLMAVLALGSLSPNAILIYSIGYALAIVAAFAVLMIVENNTGSFEYQTFYGIAKKNPILAWTMVIAMLSLAGIPLTAGFFGKFYIFSNSMDHGYYYLVAIGVINAVIGIFYYFKVIIAMFFIKMEHPFEKLTLPLTTQLTLVLICLAIVVLGIFPSLFANILN